ncbi:hypothetical protein BO70DRAFT_179148 [Aspergillus heteromorphus CBS 117.55]|uniref:Uncharacterized protein n=1 Tax=Aspergillus heteromorphus CBS 117.55 TaxID=1448321 RepID=A0A317WRG6_9EURO|nr:uncharacterized protein BO70DRAFT_179148 [Aspergillus heteromorphus CBS 117.55]PWY88321.1 hypothetical protein BO70DRAFT_179148 [Aspergillus heteromorphus CBS 117.55]
MKICWDSRSKPEKRYALALATLKCISKENLEVVPYMLAATIVRYAQPLLMSQLITFVRASSAEGTGKLQGFKLVVLAAFIYIGLAVSNTIDALSFLFNKLTLLSTDSEWPAGYSKAKSRCCR